MAMPARLRSAFEIELASARSEEARGEHAHAWRHLERAHVLGQFHAGPHVRVHGRMFGFAWRRSRPREALGQLARLALAAPGSWTGRAPRGNTGGADVGIFTPMEIPEDLSDLLEQAALPREVSSRRAS